MGILSYGLRQLLFFTKTFFMKRIILLVLSGLVMAGVYPQDKTAERYTVSGGVLGALNLTQFNTTNDANGNDAAEYDLKAGWAVGGWLNLPLGTRFSVEPQLMYSSYSYFTSNTSTLLLNDGRIRYISLPVLLKLHAGEKVAITLGPQFDFVAAVSDKKNLVQEDDFTKTSISLSGGLELFPRSRVSVFGRYIHGFTDMDNRAGHISPTEYKNQNIQLGLKLRLFGGKKTTYQATSTETVVVDTDGDGIADDVDKCPTVAGLAKYNGCPIPDTDGDGINDELDKCPTVAGIAKYDGCPIPDSDGDGINDEEDKCPTVAGVAKYDGCPVPDRDNDGINDDEDKCPDIAGTAANNGCPDVPANLSKSIGLAAEGIYFGTGANNAKLSTRSNAALDKVVAIMNENPGLKIRIEGHTDNVGNEDDLEDLSSARAKAVMDYLISKGISADRVSKEGFGGSQPIADNNTAAGRKKNNRIELRMVYY
jgi:outer membrane protein OmpA-like peptidoglycan-associated protein